MGDKLLPFLLFHGDMNGCDVMNKRNRFNFPRFHWSSPSPKYDTGWCKAIPAASYQTWNDFHGEHRTHSSWLYTFESYSKQYPWPSKINKAVWRGSRTHDKYLYGSELSEIPRGRLVKQSMEHPDLIYAGFYRLNNMYESRKDEADRIEFEDQMKYKAILDVDGNNWSARFPKLLCTNSVVIKVCVRVSVLFIVTCAKLQQVHYDFDPLFVFSFID